MFVAIDSPIRLILKLKKGFDFVAMYDSNGHIYYIRDIKPDRSEVQLNVNHTGTYKFSDNVLSYTFAPRKKFTCYIDRLPDSEKSIIPKPIKFVYNPTLNDTPARIDVNTGIIETGPRFNKLPTLVKDFIILHEIGHHYYFTETYCDQYALKNYIENYGNPSQALYSLTKVFKYPEYQIERILNIFNNIKK